MSLPPRDRPQPPGDLPIWETVCASFRSVFVEYLNYLPNAVVGPFVLSLLVEYLLFRVSEYSYLSDTHQTTLSEALGIVAVSFIGLVPYVIFAVAWHRLILLGPAEATPTVMPSMTNRHWRFYGYCLLLIVIGFGLALIIFGLPVVLVHLMFRSAIGDIIAALVALVPFLAIGLRLSLVLPPTAIDKRYRLGDAMRLSEKQGLRLAVVCIITAAPFSAVNYLMEQQITGLVDDLRLYSPDGLPNALSLYLWLALSTIVGYLATAVGVTFLSLSFRHMSGWHPPGNGQAAPTPPPAGDAGFNSP